jgi:hypothetical protein
MRPWGEKKKETDKVPHEECPRSRMDIRLLSRIINIGRRSHGVNV